MNAPLLSRRDWLSTSSAFLAASVLGVRPGHGSTATADDLVLNAKGGYLFLPVVPFLSYGALAADGFEIVRTTFRRPRPFSDGIGDIERFLVALGRPIQALCGLELRSQRQPAPAEFMAFNRSYVARLGQAGLLVDGQVPLTRTNVASAGVQEDSIHAFCYTAPITSGDRGASPTFILSAVPEIRNLKNVVLVGETPDFVASAETDAAGITTMAGLRLKTEFILTTLDGIMRTMKVDWADVTGVQLYTVRDVQPLLADLILPRIGSASRFGIEWHHTYPPNVLNILEIGIRGTRLETVL